jgi:hypothetical protein
MEVYIPQVTTSAIDITVQSAGELT